MSKKLVVEIDGKEHWVSQEQEKTLAEWNKKYPLTEKEAYPHAHGLVEKMKAEQEKLDDVHHRMWLHMGASDRTSPLDWLDQFQNIPTVYGYKTKSCPHCGKDVDKPKQDYLDMGDDEEILLINK